MPAERVGFTISAAMLLRAWLLALLAEVTRNEAQRVASGNTVSDNGTGLSTADRDCC